MKRYNVTLQVVKTYVIPEEAESQEEAENLAIQEYLDGCVGIDQWEDLPTVESVKTMSN